MDSARWRQLRELFEHAIEMAPAQREAYLRAACGDDSALQAEVQAMLDADTGDDALGDLSARAKDLLASDGEPAADPRWTGARLGPWRLLREVGRGGMGAVWLAERCDGAYAGHAAIKLMRAGSDADDLAQRFRAERQILAQLDHPNMARLIDAGQSTDGVPYLAMEYVDGEPLATWCDRRRLTIEERIRLLRSVADAVAHAHQRLIVHRDLKPSNVLVTAEGRVRLLDFGIAKLLGDDSAATGTGLQLFTPEYAAPEQIRGEPPTTAVDVYALGVMLFELLCGQRPYQIDTPSSQALTRAVLEQEPQRPSQALTRRQLADPEALALKRRTTTQRLRQRLRGDLDAIALKALRKAPSARYASVHALIADLDAWLERRPVEARRGHWSYIIARWLQRHALVAALAGAAVASLLVGLGGALWQAREANAQRALAEAARRSAEAERSAAQTQAKRAESTVNFLTEVFAKADPGSTDGAEVTARDLLSAGEREMAADSELDPSSRIALTVAIARAYMGLGDDERMLQLMRSLQPDLDRADPRTAIDGLINLGVALNRNGDRSGAFETFKAAEIWAQTHGLSDPLIQARLDLLIAIELSSLDRDAEALERMQRSHQIYLTETGPVSHETVNGLDVYIVLLEAQDRSADGPAVTQPSVDALATHPEIPLARRASILAAHAGALHRADQPAQAEPFMRQALALEEQVYGPEHCDISFSLSKLVAILRKQGRSEEALPIADRFVALRRRCNPASRMLAAALVALAQVQLLVDQAPAAQANIDEALAILRSQAAGTKVLAMALLLSGEIKAALRDRPALKLAVDELAPLRSILSPEDLRRLDVLQAAAGEP